MTVKIRLVGRMIDQLAEIAQVLLAISEHLPPSTLKKDLRLRQAHEILQKILEPAESGRKAGPVRSSRGYPALPSSKG